MDGTNDISFTSLDNDGLQKLSEFAKENLSQEQWDLLLVIFAADPTLKDDTSQEAKVPVSTDLNQLLAQLREAYMPGKPGTPTRYCVVPVKPPPPPPPPPPFEPGPGPGPYEQ